MRPTLILVLVALLASCGADGVPIAPAPAAAPTPAGVTMGGTVSVGVAKDGGGY